MVTNTSNVVKSMTGYGRGELSFDDGVQLTVELRAVNNRYLDCTVKMPRAYIFAEDAMKARVQTARFSTVSTSGNRARSVA